MKKFLAAVFLAAVMVAPAFAGDDSKFDVVGKLGILISPSYESPVSPGPDYDSYKGDAANTFAIAVEGYYKLDEKLSVGLGLSYGFESELSSQFDAYHFSGDDKAKLGFTNIYLSVKPSLSENIYAIGQIGYGISHGSFYDSYNQSEYGREFKVDGGGLYFGLGAGVEYKSFIFEILYSINTATLKEKYIWSGGTDYTFKYSSFNVNIGYKFAI